jgi:intein-encoded DNA endonuclease-like protein
MIGKDAGKSFAYILGVYLGDGSVTLWQDKKRGGPSRLYFRLNTIDRDFAKATQKALQELTDYAASFTRHAVKKSKKPNHALRCGDRVLCERLVADTEKKQIIPAYVFGWPRENRLAFIAGLMDSEGFVAANSNHTGRRFYMGFKSCDVWVPDFVKILKSVGIEVGKIGIEKPRFPGYKTPIRFAIKMQSWVDSGARFNIKRKQARVDKWAATVPDPRGDRFRAKLTPETTSAASEG